MHIAYISSSIIPSKSANSIHVMKMCNALSLSGHEITLFAFHNHHQNEKILDEIFRKYGIENNFHLIRYHLSANVFTRTLYAILVVVKINFLKTKIVICRDLIAGCLSILVGKETMIELHKPILDGSNKIGIRFKNWLFKCALKRKNFKHLVVITESLKDYFLRNYGVQEKKILVAPDGADEIDVNQISMELDNKNCRFHIGYVGHLYPGKGMEVISKIVKLCPMDHFHIVGGLDSDILNWKGQLGHFENITFYGHMDHSKVMSYLKSFDIVLLPNQKSIPGNNGGIDIGDWTSPLKLFEYMSAGKPIIASDIPVLKEILKNKENAILCSCESPEEWSTAINLLYNNPDLRIKIATNANFDFLTYYTWRKRAENILSVVD